MREQATDSSACSPLNSELDLELAADVVDLLVRQYHHGLSSPKTRDTRTYGNKGRLVCRINVAGCVHVQYGRAATTW